MSIQFCIALTTGVLSGLWFWGATELGLLVWAGFLGCTTYFALSIDGPKGLILSFTSNLSGIFWAMVIIFLSSSADSMPIAIVVTAVAAFMMCIQANKELLKFIPGTFIGACATFAADGNWQLVSLSLAGGLLTGYLMKQSGMLLHRFQLRLFKRKMAK